MVLYYKLKLDSFKSSAKYYWLNKSSLQLLDQSISFYQVL